ncbi:MAG TPA: response regulator [Stellaceae bacterium]|nr:response regulator [Stellaceae bacterium]
MTGLSDLRVLVVDDEPFMRATIRQMLRNLRVAFAEEAGDGQSALDLIAVFKPDLILCDIGMKPMGGLEFVQRLRRHADATLRETSVVMLTVMNGEKVVKEAARLRLSGYLVKPISTAQLGARLQSALAQMAASAKAAASVPNQTSTR